MKNERIGIILNHISLRSDIRLFIKELSKIKTVVLFGTINDFELLGCENCLHRKIKETTNRIDEIYNRFLKELYYFFGNIPKAKKTYHDYQIRNKYKTGTKKQIRYALNKYRLKMVLPHFFPYDRYVKLLIPSTEKISDIDVFIAFTDLNHDRLLANIVAHKKKIFTYVHSWDHIPKFTKFLKVNNTYIVWNNQIKEDLMSIHQIKKDSIKTLGASQFYFIKDYLDKKEVKQSPIGYKYIYFPCSFGYPKLAVQETKIIEFVAKELEKINDTIKLVVRAYPMLKDWEIYNSLKLFKNVIFDDFDRNKNTLLNEDEHLYKFNLIVNALAVMHTGTTIGLETSYTKTPVIYLNIKDIEYGVPKTELNHIFHSWNQYHLRKYYYFENLSSVVKSKSECKDILKLIISSQKESLLDYNETLRNYSSLINIEQFTINYLNIISNINV